MLVKTLPVGQLETNCYIVSNEETLGCVVIDPGDESNRILDYLEDNRKGQYSIPDPWQPVWQQAAGPIRLTRVYVSAYGCNDMIYIGFAQFVMHRQTDYTVSHACSHRKVLWICTFKT